MLNGYDILLLNPQLFSAKLRNTFVTKIEYPADNVNAFCKAVYNSDIKAIRKYHSKVPDLWRKLYEGHDWIISEATRESTPETIRVLVELGADINEQDSNGWTGLCWAITRDRYDVVQALLECGANPDLHCAIFHIADSEVHDPIGMAELLLKHGADINQLFIVEGLPPRNVLSEAIAIKNKELIKYLKSHGAKLPGGLPVAQKKKSHPTVAEDDHKAEVFAHIKKNIGKPIEGGIQKVISDLSHPITVFETAPSWRRKYRAFFTVGLNRVKLNAPSGAEKYQNAELIVVVPKSWPSLQKAIKQKQFAWPIQWLFKIARYPIEKNTWLGGPWTTLSNEEPPKPLGLGTDFTAWILASPQNKESIINCKDGTMIQLYTLFPVYAEEYYLEREKGVDSLMTQFKKHGLPEYIDVNRINVVTEE